MIKKLILAASLALLSFTKADAQFSRGDYRSDVMTYVRDKYYIRYDNGDVYCKDGDDLCVWKFDSEGRVYDIYLWFAKTSDDEEIRTMCNGNNDYNHESTNVWKQYFMNGKLCAQVIYGSFNTTYGDYRTPFNRTSGWHFDFRY